MNLDSSTKPSTHSSTTEKNSTRSNQEMIEVTYSISKQDNIDRQSKLRIRHIYLPGTIICNKRFSSSLGARSGVGRGRGRRGRWGSWWRRKSLSSENPSIRRRSMSMDMVVRLRRARDAQPKTQFDLRLLWARRVLRRQHQVVIFRHSWHRPNTSTTTQPK